jgi:hypothetical protein
MGIGVPVQLPSNIFLLIKKRLFFLPNNRGFLQHKRGMTNPCERTWSTDARVSTSVLQLYEDIFGVESGFEIDRKRSHTFVPSRATSDERCRWAQEVHGFKWTEHTMFSRMRQKDADEPQACDCSCEKPQNAAMMYECLSAPGCTNRQLQELAKHTKSGPDLEIFDTEGVKGYGVRALCDLEQGALICEYTGEALNARQFACRRRTLSSKSYFLRADDFVIDASRHGNTARFINHSCDPCAEVQVWSVPKADGRSLRTAVGIFARRPIQAGEEITYDYRFETFEDAAEIRCLCEAPGCRLFMGAKKGSRKRCRF